MPIFEFKQFNVIYNNDVFKIGTDAVLLGAWAGEDIAKNRSCCDIKSILDIGSGTGVVSLMIAQNVIEENSNIQILAVDSDKSSVDLSNENFQNSPWKRYLKAELEDVRIMKSYSKFDIIVSNPPFYYNSHFSPNCVKNKSKHNLPLVDLLDAIARLINYEKESVLYLIMPASIEEELVNEAFLRGLFLESCLKIEGNINSKCRRIIFKFSTILKTVKDKKTVRLEEKRGVYTSDYRRLLKDFLKFF